MRDIYLRTCILSAASINHSIPARLFYDANKSRRTNTHCNSTSIYQRSNNQKTKKILGLNTILFRTYERHSGSNSGNIPASWKNPNNNRAFFPRKTRTNSRRLYSILGIFCAKSMGININIFWAGNSTMDYRSENQEKRKNPWNSQKRIRHKSQNNSIKNLNFIINFKYSPELTI